MRIKGLTDLTSINNGTSVPSFGSRSFSWKWALTQGAVLLLLAAVTAWFLQRGETIEQGHQATIQGRSLAELVAQAVGPQLELEESSRLLKILETAARDGDLQAAVLVTMSGTIVAHTDISRTGSQLDRMLPVVGVYQIPAPELPDMLFGSMQGTVVLHPVIGAEGMVGSVALLLPSFSGVSLTTGAFRFFVPAGVLLLAFFVIGQGILRRAVRPTSEFLEKLLSALDLPETDSAAAPEPGAVSAIGRDHGEAMTKTVHRINALTKLRDELLIKSKLVDYDRKRLEMILDAFPEGLLVVNSVNEVVFINRRAMKILDLAGRREDLKNLQDMPEFAVVAGNAAKTGQVILPEPFSRNEQKILCSRVTLEDQSNQATHILYALRDVTAQQAAQKTQAEFLSQISHELKAPLNTIITFVEELAETDDLSRGQRKEYCNILTGETNRMAQLISNLLQLSRIQLGSLSTRFAFVKSSSLLRDQAESLRVQAERQDLTYRTSIPETLPALDGDKDLLGVAINNVISNAIKYTPVGGTISIDAHESESRLVIKVTDTGLGIAENERTAIFDKFYRADDEQVQDKAGTGLGLALVKEIVEIHGGGIQVESELGHGSTFRIWLPVRTVSTRPESVVETPS